MSQGAGARPRASLAGRSQPPGPAPQIDLTGLNNDDDEPSRAGISGGAAGLPVGPQNPAASMHVPWGRQSFVHGPAGGASHYEAHAAEPSRMATAPNTTFHVTDAGEMPDSVPAPGVASGDASGSAAHRRQSGGSGGVRQPVGAGHRGVGVAQAQGATGLHAGGGRRVATSLWGAAHVPNEASDGRPRYANVRLAAKGSVEINRAQEKLLKGNVPGKLPVDEVFDTDTRLYGHCWLCRQWRGMVNVVQNTPHAIVTMHK
jgi:hypothetical protein